MAAAIIYPFPTPTAATDMALRSASVAQAALEENPPASPSSSRGRMKTSMAPRLVSSNPTPPSPSKGSSLSVLLAGVMQLMAAVEAVEGVLTQNLSNSAVNQQKMGNDQITIIQQEGNALIKEMQQAASAAESASSNSSSGGIFGDIFSILVCIVSCVLCPAIAPLALAFTTMSLMQNFGGPQSPIQTAISDLASKIGGNSYFANIMATLIVTAAITLASAGIGAAGSCSQTLSDAGVNAASYALVGFAQTFPTLLSTISESIAEASHANGSGLIAAEILSSIASLAVIIATGYAARGSLGNQAGNMFSSTTGRYIIAGLAITTAAFSIASGVFEVKAGQANQTQSDILSQQAATKSIYTAFTALIKMMQSSYPNTSKQITTQMQSFQDMSEDFAGMIAPFQSIASASRTLA